MKVQHSLSLLALAVGVGFSTSALAQTGDINFTGKVIDVTCTPVLTSPELSGPNTVVLPTVPVSALAAPNSTAGEREFAFDMTACTVNPNTTRVWFHFGGGNVDANGRLTNTLPAGPATASNVTFELWDDSPGTTAIVAGGAAPTNVAPTAQQGTFVDFTNPPTKRYSVRYHSVPGMVSADAGDIASSVVYTAVYF